MTRDPEDLAMAALVEADRATTPPPDLAALRTGGRRHLRRRRLAGVAVTVAVVAAVAVPAAVVSGRDDDRAGRLPATTTTATTSPTPTAAPDDAEVTDPDPPPVTAEEEGEVELSDGSRQGGTWEGADVLGATIRLTSLKGFERVLYARREAAGDICLAVGLRVGRRILRLLCAVTPADPATERFVMWGGARIAEGIEDDDLRPHYLLVGVVEGDTEVSVAAAGQAPRAVTTRRTDVLPGSTVFVDEAPWDEGWDPLQLAPLIVTTGSGLRLEVPTRSYVS